MYIAYYYRVYTRARGTILNEIIPRAIINMMTKVCVLCKMNSEFRVFDVVTRLWKIRDPKHMHDTLLIRMKRDHGRRIFTRATGERGGWHLTRRGGL